MSATTLEGLHTPLNPGELDVSTPEAPDAASVDKTLGELTDAVNELFTEEDEKALDEQSLNSKDQNRGDAGSAYGPLM